MTIVIPMAGLSQRFLDAGFTLPKYMLYAGNKSLFKLSVSSFKNHFDNCNFLFIARDLYDTSRFIDEECELMGIKNYKTVILDKPTKGQAETVYLGLRMSGINEDESITIFNIDTFHYAFSLPKRLKEWDGYLEVFVGDGANWSYAKTESETSSKVIETAEKLQISNYCSTGLYYFKNISLFNFAYCTINLKNIDTREKELYVAPLYNYLIADEKNIHIYVINRRDIEICGTPSEYNQYLADYHVR